MRVRRDDMLGSDNLVYPRIKKRLDVLVTESRQWTAAWDGMKKIQVKSGTRAVRVDLEARSCDYRNSIQFGGSSTEDPSMHIRDFIEICDTFKFNGLSEDAVKLRLFPFSLRDKSKSWLHSLPAGLITTWEDLAQKFLTKFLPMAKTTALRNAITQFAHQMGESLCKAWERYKEMLRKCPHHGMSDWMIINCFYNGLGPQSRPMLDAASGGALWEKSYEEAYDLIELMVTNEYQYPTQRCPQGKVAGVLEVDTATAITAQLKALSMKIDSLANYGVKQIISVCELCAGPQVTEQYAISSDSAQFVSNFQRSQQPVPDTYHPDNWNHPNFSWSNNQNAMQQPFQQFGNNIFNLPGFQQQITPKQQTLGACLSSNEKSELEELRLMCKNQALICQRTLPSDTEINPGKREVEEQKEPEVEPRKIIVEHTPPEGNTGEKQIYPSPSFPKRLQKKKLDKQFEKFLEVFKKLHINIPFAEALEQMPSYARNAVVLQQKLPPKLKDPESFTIPCTIGNLSFDKCLCDLGARINLTPLSIFKKLGLPDPKPTYMSLQLVDRFIAYPRGIVEDVLVKVDKLIFPADFVILDFKEDKKIPIILGRPFLATGRTMIDERLELSIEDISTLELHPLSDHLSYTFLGAPHDKGLRYIFDDVEGSRTNRPMPIEGSSHVQQVVDRTGVGDEQYRRVIRRMEAMHDIHHRFAADLTQALGIIF
ncbi:hypothetical protein AgCh_011756 [Apium graveolens]